jgi:hypothetical protein
MKRCLIIEKQYLVWLDILGFEEMAREISEKLGVSERKVRDDFVRVINEKVKEVEDKGEIVGKRFGEGEDWLLVTPSLDSVFKIITIILDHNTEYKHYEKVPLEIGIGVGKYDKWARLDGSRLITETSTIKFLKTPIIDYYREWYRRTYSSSIRSTFIVLTELVYNEMERFDKEICKKVEYDSRPQMKKKNKFSFFIAETEKVIQRGMVFDFLERIGKSRSSWYRRIDRIFVPPNEYKNIIDCLEKWKVVFLVGDPEIGKTFTSLRILWEYYSQGYHPIWYSGSELGERIKIRQIMSDCKIVENSVVYLEDPFGKTRFEDREELRRTIGSFLSRIQVLNARVLITSREEVFKQFNREKLSQSDLQALTVEMRLMKPSYDRKQMETILLNWATEFGCNWLQRDDIRSFIIAKMVGTLTTPLSLRDFALASKDITDVNTIESLIKEKSREVKEAFAEEIAKMNKEKIMFLSLVYILHLLKTEKIKTIYNDKCHKFRLDSETNPFDYLLDHFESRISQGKDDAAFKFAHPSYEEGLVLSWNKIGVKPLLLKLVNELVKDNDWFVRGLCGFCLTKNFSDISFKDEGTAIIKAVLHDKNADARNGVAEAVRYFFGDISDELAFDLLNIMINDKNRFIRAAAIATVGENFKRFPIQESLRLISRGLEDRAAWVRFETVHTVRSNMEDLPEEFITKALELHEQLCHYTGWFIGYFASLGYSDFKEKVEEWKRNKERHVVLK